MGNTMEQVADKGAQKFAEISDFQVATLASIVRICQKRYFADRTKENLIASKQAESELDKAIAARRSTPPSDDVDLQETTIHFNKVREFMCRAGQSLGSIDRTVCGIAPTARERRRAADLILEEAGELVGGLGFSVEWIVDEAREGFNLIETIDGVFDVQVVATCVLVMLGVPDAYIRNAIDDNNLAKFGPGHSIRDDGKLVKPDDHEAVDIASILDRMTRKTGA